MRSYQNSKLVNYYTYSINQYSEFQNIFRRHCVLAKILVDYEAVVHIDGDMGIVNPKRRIQEYMTESSDIVFYDRHFAPEVAMCYIVKNTEYAITLLNGECASCSKLSRPGFGCDFRVS